MASTTSLTGDAHQGACGVRQSTTFTATASDQADAKVPCVAEMPDGSVVMLSPDNPYSCEAAAGTQRRNGATEGDDAVCLLPQFISAALRLERMARVVRLLAIIDMVLSMTHVIVSVWPAVMAVGMSYCGYAGAKLFRRDLTQVYLAFLMLFAAGRVAICTRYFLVSDELGLSPSMRVHLTLSAGIQLVIAHFVWRFCSLLPSSLLEARLVQHVAEQHSLGGALSV